MSLAVWAFYLSSTLQAYREFCGNIVTDHLPARFCRTSAYWHVILIWYFCPSVRLSRRVETIWITAL